MKLWQHQPQLDFPLRYERAFAGMASATTDAETQIGLAVYPVVVQSVQISFDAAVTGAATNNFAATVNLYRGGVKQGALASLTFASGVNASQWVAKDLGAIAAAYKSLKAGDVLTLALTHNGTGMQAPSGLVVVDLRTPKSGE